MESFVISWDEDKRNKVLSERGIDFEDLEVFFENPYLEEQKNDDPEQYRLVGRLYGGFVTFIVEYEEDDLGELIWVVTAWNSTREERENYEREIEGR